MAKDIAVVVSTYNRPRALDLVLMGLSNQTCLPKEIIIADDGSTKETAELINRWQDAGLPVKHVWHEDRGYRKTIIMNQAFSMVTARHTIFMDGDCIPLENFVAHHVKYFEERCVLAGPRILASKAFTERLEQGRERIHSESFVYWIQKKLHGEINRLGPLITLPDGGWRRAKPKKWELVRGCNFSVGSRYVWDVDGFEESLYGWGPDDSDIAVRLINKGLSVKTLRFAAPVLHLWHREEDRGNLQKNRDYLLSAISDKRTQALVGLSSHHYLKPFINSEEG